MTKHAKSKTPIPVSLSGPQVRCLNLDCGEEIPAHARSCVVCGQDAGFPNVRAAQVAEEQAALTDRVNSSREDARKRNCLTN